MKSASLGDLVRLQAKILRDLPHYPISVPVTGAVIGAGVTYVLKQVTDQFFLMGKRRGERWRKDSSVKNIEESQSISQCCSKCGK